MKELTLQIKPVGNHCNLRCSYCYAMPFKSKRFQILDLNLLEKLIKEAFEITNNVIVSWHGGEPTMAGLNYFKEYMNIINKYKKENQNIVNMIQTNATLIDDELAQFFKENDFIVSVSLDGDEKSHNKNRYNNAKVGSFNKTMEGVQILRKYGINPPVIATVSQSTYEDGIRNFDFFVNSGFKEIKYSPVYDSCNDEFSISNDKWSLYLKNILYRWLEIQKPEIKVREIDEILMWYAGKTASLCANRGMCAKWISIDEKGDIYPCEYLRSSNSYGNIKNDSLKEVFKAHAYEDFKEKIMYKPKQCETCKLFTICHNGCPATRVDNDKLTYKGVYVYCKQRKMLFDEIEKIINS